MFKNLERWVPKQEGVLHALVQLRASLSPLLAELQQRGRKHNTVLYKKLKLSPGLAEAGGLLSFSLCRQGFCSSVVIDWVC